MPKASDFLRVAASQLGFREPFVNGSYNNDTPYGRWYGLNFQPYCAMGASWCANEVGVLGTLVPKTASSFAMLSWFRKREQTGVWPPRPGDIGILREYNPGVWNADPDGWATIHTLICEKYLGGDQVQTIEFNTNGGGSSQGNGVWRLRRTDPESSKRIVWCRPKWDPEDPPKPAPEKPTSTTTPAPSKPTPAPAPAKPSKPRIKVANVRPGKRNEDIGKFNDLLWAWHGPDYRRRMKKRWESESRTSFGPVSQEVMLAAYRTLAKREGAAKWPIPVNRRGEGVWPGPDLVTRIGGQPV